MTPKSYHVAQNAFDDDYLSHLATELCKSEYLGASPLGAEFVNTEGFSLVFRRSALLDVCHAFPYLEPYLDEVLFPECNAFYLNPLLLTGSSRVDAHVDCRLVASENTRIIPNLVSVLYVEICPDMAGGNLLLNVGTEHEVCITPETNNLVHFRGSVIHRVSEVKNPHRRISVVCEQYNLPDALLAGFPLFNVITDDDLLPRVAANNE